MRMLVPHVDVPEAVKRVPLTPEATVGMDKVQAAFLDIISRDAPSSVIGFRCKLFSDTTPPRPVFGLR